MNAYTNAKLTIEGQTGHAVDIGDGLTGSVNIRQEVLHADGQPKVGIDSRRRARWLSHQAESTDEAPHARVRAIERTQIALYHGPQDLRCHAEARGQMMVPVQEQVAGQARTTSNITCLLY